MADRKSYAGINFKQDMAPPGGYQDVMWQRTFPKTWANARRLFGVFLGINVYGWFQYYSWKKTRNSLYLDETDVQNAIQPFLKAERDRNYLKMCRKNRELEDEVMKDVPGWKTGTWYGEPVYYTLGEQGYFQFTRLVYDDFSNDRIKFPFDWFDLWRDEVWAHGDRYMHKRSNWFSEHPEYCGPKWYDKYIPQWILDHIY